MTMHISLLENYSNKGKSHAFKSKGIHDFFEGILESNFSDSRLYKGCIDFYPWCFVLPPFYPRSKNYTIGALLMLHDSFGAYSFFVLHSQVSYEWLIKNLQSNFHIAFWLARVLANISKKEIEDQDFSSVQAWVRALKRSYSPIWESIFLNEKFKFKGRSTLLLSELTQLDYEHDIGSGVEMMPWTDWPGCVQSEDYAWFWRQSRYGRIIDSQKIKLDSDDKS